MTRNPEPLASAEALTTLSDRLSSLDVGSVTSDDDLMRARGHIVDTIESYLLPRVSGESRPLTVVFAGPTGAGKSTLINSVARRELSKTGPLRPTTTAPYVYALNAHRDSYSDLGGIDCVVVGGEAPVLRTMTLVDTPDIDSTAAEHRVRAEKLIDAADIVVFVSSATRYADRVPWEVLRRAQSRGAPVICVLNRLPSTADAAVNDYRRMLMAEDLGPSLLAIAEHHLAGSFLPLGSVRSLREALVRQVENHRMDESATTRRVLDATCADAADLIDALRSAVMAVTGPVLDLTTPVMPLLDDYGYGRLAIDELATASRSRFRARWVARRINRDQLTIDAEQTRLTDSLVLQIDRWGLRARGGLAPEDFRELSEVVAAWVNDFTLPVSAGPKRNRELAGLLARIAAASMAVWPRRAFEIITRTDPTNDIEALRAELDASLSEIFAPAIETNRADRTMIDRVDMAREALSEVIVSVAFVDA